MQGSAVAPNWNDRPLYTAPAPALLGFDETILGYCSREPPLTAVRLEPSSLHTCVHMSLELMRARVSPATDLVGLDFDGGDLNTELAERCVRANKNVLRLLE